MNMFTKIKYSTKGTVEIHWVTLSEETPESIEHKLVAEEEPRKEYPAALKAFAGYVADICELPKSWRESLTVISIRLTPEKKEEGRGLVVTAMRTLGNGLTLMLNTPYLTEFGFHEGALKWPQGLQDLVHRANEEAKSYREGDRAQQILKAS